MEYTKCDCCEQRKECYIVSDDCQDYYYCQVCITAVW